MPTHKHIRSSTGNKRPTTAIADGQIALNTNAASPGLFFKDSTGASIIKVGPVHVGTTAPNVTPASGGSSGNSTGEVWLDTSLTPNGVKIWSGSAWVNATPIGSTTVQGLLELATNAETQTGSDTARAVTPAALQSKMSDSATTTSATTIASSTAVKAAYDLANAALPKSGGTVTGALEIGTTGSLVFEGSTADGFETTLAVVDPTTADRTITLPNVTGTVITSGDTGTVTSTMIADGTIVNADISASAAIADTKLATITTAGKVSGTAITSGNIATSGQLEITNSAPLIRLTDSESTATHSQSVLARDGDQFQIQTRSSAGVFVSTDYSIIANASGATNHVWRIANTEQIRLDSSGRLLKGITTVFNVAGSAPGVQIASLNTASGAHLNVGRFNNDTGSPLFTFAKSRSGTAGIVGSAVISGDTLGNISFAGDDGTDLNTTGATIAARVSGTVSSDVIPTALALQTMNTSGTLADRLYIQPNGNVSIGGTGSSSANLEVDKTITGAPTAYGVVVDGTVQSDVTASAVGFATSLDTANTSFTLTNLIHFHTTQPAFGASSTVTTQYGFNAASSLTGATTNYGFYGQLSSASGRWNFYANGSAPNYFAGDVRTNTVFTDRTAAANSNVTATATASSLLDGIRTGTPAADIDLQVPTGANMEAAFQDLQTNQAFEWSVINLATAASGFDITVTNNTTHTLVGNMKVTGETSGRFKTRKTATDTFITYRIA